MLNFFKSFKKIFIYSLKHFLGDTYSQFPNMNISDMNRCISLINNCLSLIKGFYKSQTSFYDNVEDIFPHYDSFVNNDTTYNSSYLNSKTKFNPKNMHNNTLKLTPESRWQLKNGIIKPNIENIYNPDTSTIGEYENKYLVYMFQFIASFLNKRVIISFKGLEYN